MRKYASEEALRQAEATAVSSSSESSMSDFSEDEAQVIFKKNFALLFFWPKNIDMELWSSFSYGKWRKVWILHLDH